MKTFRSILWGYIKESFWHLWIGIVAAVISLVEIAEWLGKTEIPIPNWARFAVGFGAFSIAQFIAYYNLRRKLSSPEFSEERRHIVQAQLNDLEPLEKEILRELTIRGQMSSDSATTYMKEHGLGPLHLNVLALIEGKTDLVRRDFVGQYTLNAELEELVKEIVASADKNQ